MRVRIQLAAVLLVIWFMSTMPWSGAAQSNVQLVPDQRVYDLTGDSLTSDQIQDLETRLDRMAQTGPDAIVVVRDLMADPSATLAQVEAIQQEWAATAGIDDDLAVAILILRNPGDQNDARAGIYVGRTLNDGNVPEGEQRAIVEHELIPPLREGDVYTGLVNSISRVESSFVNGPPRSRFDKWSENAASSWLTPIGMITAAVLTAVSGWLFRKREPRLGLPLAPTTQRPDSMPPALGGALAIGSPQPSAVPATLLRLAEQGAIVFELESEGSRFTKPKLQVRLLELDGDHDEVEQTVLSQLARRSDGGVVSSKDLQKVAADASKTNKAIARYLREQGWTTSSISTARNWMLAVFAIGILLGIFSMIITIKGGHWLSLLSAVGLFGSAVATMWLYIQFSPFTSAGQEFSAPWKAYRDGLNAALKERATPLDLNAVLTDAVALNLGNRVEKRVEAAHEAGVVLSAFASSNLATSFPVWLAFNSTISTASGSGSTVSGGGAGGGGGAAGST